MEKILTLVIPTYNMASVVAEEASNGDKTKGITYLDKCLSSLIVPDQEMMSRLEVLVIIDGATDRSPEIAHGYAARFPDTFRVIDKENGNYGSCINRGLKEMTGKYVKVLDADDWFDTDVLARFLEFLSTVEVDLVLSRTVMVAPNGTIIEEHERMEDLPPRVPQEVDQWIEDLGFKLVMHNAAYRTDVFKRFDYNQTEGISYTDTEWVCEPLVYCDSMIYFDEVLYHYLTGREGQTMSPEALQKKTYDLMTVARSVLDTYCGYTGSEKKKRLLLLRFQNYITWLYHYCGAIKLKKEITKLEKAIKDQAPDLYKEMQSWTAWEGRIELMALKRHPWLTLFRIYLFRGKDIMILNLREANRMGILIPQFIIKWGIAIAKKRIVE